MTYKEATNYNLIHVFQTEGVEKALGAASYLMHSKKYVNDVKFRTEMQGEICETVLEILIREYCRVHPKETADWVISKGLILFERGRTPKDFLTEIDLVLTTQECLFLFECKSYAGDKELVGDGELVRTDGRFGCDVYRQSCLHRRTLEPWVEDFCLRGKIPLLQMCMFNYSNGTLKDKRRKTAVCEMPCLCVDNAMKYITSFKEPVWDMVLMKQAMQKLENISSNLVQAHLEYVRSLNQRR